MLKGNITGFLLPVKNCSDIVDCGVADTLCLLLCRAA